MAEHEDRRELLHRAAGFPFALEIDHVGFWDLRPGRADAAPDHAGRILRRVTDTD